MAQTNERLDRLVLEARRSAENREQCYRAQALKLFPWVCGRCARTFDHANLQLLEVHHKSCDTGLRFSPYQPFKVRANAQFELARWMRCGGDG